MSSPSLQCIAAIKNRSRVPSTKGLEAAVTCPSDFNHPSSEQRATRAKKNQLYDVEIVEEKGSEVRVHYCGYSSEYDEWKPKVDIKYVAPPFQQREEDFSPLTHLACCIKKGLLPSRSGDPEVRIQVPCDIPSFRVLQEVAKPLSERGTMERYKILQYSDLDNVLGQKWHFRVVNEAGDFSYVILETLSFYLTKGKPILDYSVEKKEDTFTFKPFFIEQCNFIIFKFIRGDGNKLKLLEFL